ncbi:hypothetical protein C0989_009421 [Termitomyces sp. Mn162]|nr:hypothetical protein C0989_009421 [Termitomyces sp. Mn162]
MSSSYKYRLAKCREAYLFFTHDGWTDLFWVLRHETVRKRILHLLSSEREAYMMANVELFQWCEEVFEFFKKQVKRHFKRQASVELQQVLVDAMDELVEVVRGTDNKPHILRYYEYLIKLCQRTSLFPNSFVIPYPEKLDDEAIETGGSARVFYGYHDQKEVAIKEYRMFANRIPEAKKRLLKEAYITKILYHPNIIAFVGVVMEPLRIGIVVPWMRNGNIISYLATYTSLEVSRKELLEQVADGLHFIHEYGIAHGDLKGGNILISDDGKALLSDLGVAALQENVELVPTSDSTPRWRTLTIQHCKDALRKGGYSEDQSPSLFSRLSNISCGGTYRWMAPELLIPEVFNYKSGKATFLGDVFSFAMLAIEVYTGEPPHCSETREQAVLKTISGTRPKQPSNMPKPVWLLIEHCWKQKSDERPLMFDVYSSLACIP